jgi:hypothetical protein
VFIDITQADFDAALQRNPARAQHCWHNPVAIAIERTLGGHVAITNKQVHTTSHGVFPLSHVARQVVNDWRYGRNTVIDRLEVRAVR